MKVSEWGFPFDLWVIQAIMVKTYIQKCSQTVAKFKNNVPSADWVRSFLKRHSDITHMVCQNIKVVYAGVTPKVVQQYFTNLKESLTTDEKFVPVTHILTTMRQMPLTTPR